MLLPWIPLLIAVVVWWLFARWNRRRRWFSLGELVFWDAILLSLIQLAWLRFF